MVDLIQLNNNKYLQTIEWESEPLDQFAYDAILDRLRDKYHWYLLTRVLRNTGRRVNEIIRKLTPGLVIEETDPEGRISHYIGIKLSKKRIDQKFIKVGLNGPIGVEVMQYARTKAHDKYLWPQDYTSYEKAFKKASMSALNEPHTPHQLRNLYAVELIEKGQPLPVVSKLLGHSNEKTTLEWYAKQTSRKKREINYSINA